MLHHRILACVVLSVACIGALAGGCGDNKPTAQRVKIPPRYANLPARKVPAYLKDTVFEKCDVTNTEPFLISAYGFVSNLNSTGDCTAPNAVRDYMVKEMIKHKW